MKSVLNKTLVLGGLILAGVTANLGHSVALATNHDNNISLVKQAMTDDEQADSAEAETMLA